MFWAFLIGNLLYYIVGIALAFYFQEQPCVLQIYLSCHGVFEAYEL